MKKNIILSIICIITLVSCSDPNRIDRRTVTVTIEPLRYFTEQIAGDKFKVVTMVPKGSNPETYEPTARQMVDLHNSDLYIKVGNIGFERTWMKKLEANVPHIIIIDSSAGINRAMSPDDVTDPHTWMSTDNAIVIARNIYKALAGIDNSDSLYFKSNLESLISDIEATDTKVRGYITKHTAKSFLIYHPALTYFARDYHLEQIPIEEEGREPSAAQLQAVIQRAKKKNARVMFVQKEYANRNTDIVAKSIDVTKVEINPLSYKWNEEMVNIAKQMK